MESIEDGDSIIPENVEDFNVKNPEAADGFEKSFELVRKEDGHRSAVLLDISLNEEQTGNVLVNDPDEQPNVPETPAEIPIESPRAVNRETIDYESSRLRHASGPSEVSTASANITYEAPAELLAAFEALHIASQADEYKRRSSVDEQKYYFTDETELLSVKFGLPNSGNLFQDENYILCYDRYRRIPYWVCRYLMKKHLEGNTKKEGEVHYEPDLEVLSKFQTSKKHYKGAYKCYDVTKGHMVPPADVNFSQEAVNRTYRLSQIIPQNKDLNSGHWNQLEIKYRSLVEYYHGVIVIGVAIFLPEEHRICEQCDLHPANTIYHRMPESDCKDYWLRNRVLGSIDGPHVPTHCAMIIVVVDEEEEPIATGAYCFPNTKPDKNLSDYETSISQIEKMAGLTFFDKMKNITERVTTRVAELPAFNNVGRGLKRKRFN